MNLDRWREVLQALRRNPLRTTLTACGVFWGVFMLVAMLGFGNGLERAVMQSMGSWAANTVFVWTEQTSKAYAGRQPGRRVVLREDDMEALRTRVRGVELVVPRNTAGGWGGNTLVSRNGRSDNYSVNGDLPEYELLEPLVFERGRFLDPGDVRDRRKVAVIGARVREHLFLPGEDPIGQTIRLGTAELTVVGVFHSTASGSQADWQNGRVFIPRTTFARVFGTGDRVDYFAVLVAADRSSADVEREIGAVLRERHAIAPDDPRGIASYNRERDWQRMRGLFLGIGALTWTVGLMTLLAGAIGVSNIMMIAVAERTKEIGVRKAIGATPWSILTQIVQEALVLTGLAGYAGLVAGVGVLELAAFVVERMPKSEGPSLFAAPQLDLGIALVAVVVLTAAGGLAGFAPARSALAIRPAIALAHE
jgi:putative ABC transport system permease protein